MQFQVIVSLFSGLKPLCLQFSVDESDPPSLHDLRLRLSELLSIAPEDQRITTEGGRSVEDDAPLFNHHDQDENVFPPVFNLLLRLPGGKGGFGSMLRAQGGKMASQKTSNFEACRDLSGRRLKTVNDAKKYDNASVTYPSLLYLTDSLGHNQAGRLPRKRAGKKAEEARGNHEEN